MFKNYRYGRWNGNKNGTAYNKDRCAKEVCVDGEFIARQCLKKSGHGLNGLFCKQHKESTRP